MVKKYWKTLDSSQKEDLIKNICITVILCIPIFTLLSMLIMDYLSLKPPKIILVTTLIPLVVLELTSFICLFNYDLIIHFYDFKCKNIK